MSLLAPLAGVVVAITLQQLWLWLGRRSDPVPMWTSTWGGATLLFLGGHALQLQSTTTAGIVAGGRTAWVGALAIVAVMVGLTHALTGQVALRRALPLFGTVSAILALTVVLTDLIVTPDVYVRTELFGWRYFAPVPGPLMPLIGVYILAALVFVWRYGLVPPSPRLFRGEQRALQAGFMAYAACGLNDVLHAARIIQSVRLFDYGFVLVALGLTYLLTHRHNRLQTELEMMVATRTRELSEALATTRSARAAAERGREELAALLRAGRNIMSGLDLQSTLGRIVEETAGISGSPHVKILLVDGPAGVLRVGALAGSPVPDGFVVPVGRSYSGTVAATGQPLFVPDTRADPRSLLAERDQDQGLVTYLGLPVRKGVEVLGVLTINTERPHVYEPEELEVLGSLADQAALAVDSARLYESATARERRLATLATLTQSLTATLSLDEVLDRVARHAVELFGSSEARLWLVEEESEDLVLRAAAGSTSPDRGVTRMRRDEGIVGRIVTSGVPVFIEDLEQGIVHPNTARHRAEGLRTFAGVPLQLGPRVLGSLGVAVRERRRFSEEEIQLLQMLANHAAIAIENARLYEAVEARLHRLETVTRLNHLISSSLDRDRVLTEITLAAARLSEATVAAFWLADEHARVLDLIAVSDPALSLDVPVRRLGFDQALVGWIASHRQRVKVSDVLVDPRVDWPDWVRHHGLRSFYGAPVVAEGALIGVLTLIGRQPLHLGPDEENSFESFVAQAAVAARNASLYQAEWRARREAEQALAQVKQLQGLLPICAWCKRVRNDRNYWEQIEGYISERSQATFSHGICPDCRAALAREIRAEREPSS